MKETEKERERRKEKEVESCRYREGLIKKKR